MSERREKQRKFQESKNDEIKDDEEIKWDEKREITIVTWGNRLRKHAPNESQHNFNVCGVSYKKRANGTDLRTMTGMNEELKNKIATAPRFDKYTKSIVKVVERDNLSIISINCHKGRHRSVSVANFLKDKYWNNAKVFHIELGKNY